MDGSRGDPRDDFMVVGAVKDSSGTLSQSIISHDFLARNGVSPVLCFMNGCNVLLNRLLTLDGLAGCGASPADLLQGMCEYKARGLDESDAPMVIQLETLLDVMEKGCLLRIERCTTSEQWIVSIADPPT